MTDLPVTDRDQLRREADEQSALRRVATLVAGGIAPAALFGVVAVECGVVLRADKAALVRFDRDHAAVIVGTWEKPGAASVTLPLGLRWPAAEESGVSARVRRAGRPAWVTGYESESGAERDWAIGHGIRSSVASPIMVGGQPWGALIAFAEVPPADSSDSRRLLLAFSELVALAIAGSQRGAHLAASRARVVAAADETRRRIERDLHGTQQRLISLALEIRAAQSRALADQQSQAEQWSAIARGLTDAVDELRQIAQAVHPAALDKGGLAPAVRGITRRAGVPVKLSLDVPGELPRQVKVAAYYAVSEALANAVKHARASVIEVDLGVDGGDLRLEVRDDGAGGADAALGSGLTALSDRVEAADGRLEIASPAGGGTTVLVTIPLPA